MTPRLKEKYNKTIAPSLMQEFGIVNKMDVPKVSRVSVNVGVGKVAGKDGKIIEAIASNIALITGQKPVVRSARKSIAAFKLREGMPVGVSVTLRGNRMYEFLDRFVSIALPRVRDFRGLNPKAFDNQGNYSVGIKEQAVFPELPIEKTEMLHGLQVNITIQTKNKDAARSLLKQMGFPFAAK